MTADGSAGRRKIGVLISGRGSNMVALAADCAEPDHPGEIAVVISNIAGAAGLTRAADLGLAVETVAHTDFAGRPAFERALDQALRRRGVEVICLAGFMRVLSAEFIAGWAGKILNIHPSLLPSFRGLDAAGQAAAAGVRIHGASVHEVIADLDAGPIIAQAAIPAPPGADADALSAALLAVEHQLYPHALRLFLSDDAPKPETEKSGALFSPPLPKR